MRYIAELLGGEIFLTRKCNTRTIFTMKISRSTVHVCIPYRYGTASYDFCSLQVTHKIDLPSVILQLWLFLITHTVNTSAFYSFGVSAGDTQLPQEDDSSSAPINLTVPIPFFGRLERTLYVSPQLVLYSWDTYLATVVISLMVGQLLYFLFK